MESCHWCVYYSLSHVPTRVTPQTVARQAPLSMGFSRQEYWSGLPFPSPAGDCVPVRLLLISGQVNFNLELFVNPSLPKQAIKFLLFLPVPLWPHLEKCRVYWWCLGLAATTPPAHGYESIRPPFRAVILDQTSLSAPFSQSWWFHPHLFWSQLPIKGNR